MRKRSYEEETLQVTCGEPGGAQLSGSVSSYSTSPAAWESAREATPRRDVLGDDDRTRSRWSRVRAPPSVCC